MERYAQMKQSRCVSNGLEVRSFFTSGACREDLEYAEADYCRFDVFVAIGSRSWRRQRHRQNHFKAVGQIRVKLGRFLFSERLRGCDGQSPDPNGLTLFHCADARRYLYDVVFVDRGPQCRHRCERYTFTL